MTTTAMLQKENDALRQQVIELENQLARQEQTMLALQEKLAEATLNESEEKYRLLVETANEGIWAMDREHQTTYVNQAMAKMLGYTPAEMLGKKVEEFLFAEDMAFHGERMRQRHTGQDEVYERRFKRRDGSALWTLVSARVIKDSHGEFNGSFAMFTDITERKLAEAERQVLAKFPAENPNPVIRVSYDGWLLYANQASLALLNSWRCTVGQPLPAPWHQLSGEVLNSGVREEVEVVCGEHIYALVFSPIIEDRYVNIYGHDITERKRAEDKLLYQASLLQNVSDAIIATDLEFKITSWNQAAETIYGWPAAEVIGQPIANLLQTTYAVETHEQVLQQFLAQGFWQGEAIQTRKDGSEVTVLASVSLIKDSAGQPVGAVAVNRDITECKQIEAERQANLRFFTSMDQVNRAIQGTNDLEQMMSDVLGVVLSIFDCDRVFLVHPCNPAAAAWRVPMERTRPEYPGALALGLVMPMTPPVAETFRTLLAADGPVKFGPETPYPLPADVSERFGFKSLLAMALYPKAGQPWQFGLHQCTHARIWTTEEERLFQEIGRRLADALTSLLQYRNLRDSERRLTEAQRIAHIGYWERDLEAGRITLSDEACRVFGLTPQDFSLNLEQWHQRWLELIHPEDRGRVAQAAAEALRDGPPYNLEYRIIRPNGEVRFIHSEAVVHRAESGRPRSMMGMMQDITERKQAEAALRESEERFRLFMDNSPTIAWIKNEGGRLVYLNRTYENRYGMRLADWFGKTDFEVWPAEVAEQFRQSDQAVLAAGHEIQYTEKILNPDGSLGAWWTFKFPLRDAAGQRYVAGIGLDITERQQIEAELNQTNERFTQLAESIEEVFWVFDLREQQILYLSPAYETIWGQPRENVYQNPNFFIETVFPDDLPLVREAREGELRGERASWEYRIQRPDGSIRWLWERSFPIFDDAGQLIRLTGVASDITERKQMETQLRQWADAFENCAHGLTLGLPATNQILTCNPAFARLQGRTIAEISGMPILSAYAPEDHTLVRQSIAEADRTGSVRYEARMVRKDGSVYPVQMDVVSVRDTNGNLLYRVTTQQDISERKAAEAAQTKLEEQLRQAQKLESIGRLAGGVAHDFNNLLTVILGYTDLIQVQLPSHDPLQEKLAQVQQAAEQAEALTQQLLAFSRKQILAPVVLDLNELVGNLHKMLGRLIGEDIILEMALQPGLRVIKADPGQMEQVLLNLAVNARDAMPKGGRLTIQTANVQLEGVNVPGVLLAVADTGHGMDETILAHIFEPFFTTKEQGKGTGLGLATVYGIVKQSGGEITVESQPGQGTTFKIYLPADGAAVAGSTSPQPQRVARPGYETILLVEDNPMVRNLVRIALRNYGYTLLEAEQGQQALALAAQQEGAIDLLLTDVIMPELSGREVAERLKALYPHIKVLFMSGYTDDEVIQHGLLTAEVEFISKPFSPKTLAAKVREILDK